MKKTLEFVLIVFLAYFPITATSQMTGSMRQEFLQGSESSCFKTQRAASASRDIPDQALKKYCRCFSVYLADSLNNEVAISIFQGEQKFNNELIAMGYRYCSKNFSKY